MMERLLFHNYVRIIKNTKQKLLFQWSSRKLADGEGSSLSFYIGLL
jgi:hypothetical protein